MPRRKDQCLALTEKKLEMCLDDVAELCPIELKYGRWVVKRFRLFQMERFRELAKLPR